MNYTPFGVSGALPQFKETVEPCTLSHWVISKKLKFWTLNFASNEVFCKPKSPHNVKLYLFWVLGAFPHFGKTGFNSGQSIFCNMGVMALWSKPAERSLRCRDPTPPIPALVQKVITLSEWDCLLDNSQNLAMGQPNNRKKIPGIKSK